MLPPQRDGTAKTRCIRECVSPSCYKEIYLFDQVFLHNSNRTLLPSNSCRVSQRLNSFSHFFPNIHIFPAILLPSKFEITRKLTIEYKAKQYDLFNLIDVIVVTLIINILQTSHLPYEGSPLEMISIVPNPRHSSKFLPFN